MSTVSAIGIFVHQVILILGSSFYKANRPHFEDRYYVSKHWIKWNIHITSCKQISVWTRNEEHKKKKGQMAQLKGCEEWWLRWV